VTIAQIAEHADVAGSTIYALFGSKAGILRALMRRAIFNADYERIASELRGVADPIEQLRLTAAVARSIYDGESKEMALLRGASAFSPELKKLEREFEDRRYEIQSDRLANLFERQLQRPDVSLKQARDLVWMLTSRDVYRMLVIERKVAHASPPERPDKSVTSGEGQEDESPPAKVPPCQGSCRPGRSIPAHLAGGHGADLE
jgi:AcrR family transcriptional regulator